MKMKLRKCSCGGTAEIVDGEPTELGAKMLREYGLTPSRTCKHRSSAPHSLLCR